MILADFECQKCGKITEHYVDAQQKAVKCQCGGKAKKIISLPGVYVNSENPVWIKAGLSFAVADESTISSEVFSVVMLSVI